VKILVTFALANEFAPWRARHQFREGRLGAAPAWVAEIGGADVFVVLTGVGPERAAQRASEAMRDEDIDICISAGLAGALRSEHRSGEILTAHAALSGAASAGPAQKSAASDPRLVELAARCGAKVVDSFITTGRMIATAEEKLQLGVVADAVEMESFSLLSQAAARGIRPVAIRAVSDLANENLPLDFTRVLDRDGMVSFSRVAGEAVRQPGTIPGLVRLGRKSRKAAESLAEFLDAYIAISAPEMEPERHQRVEVG
jgi:adenosylhomocysteine nucleosidase